MAYAQLNTMCKGLGNFEVYIFTNLLRILTLQNKCQNFTNLTFDIKHLKWPTHPSYIPCIQLNFILNVFSAMQELLRIIRRL